MSAFLEWVMKAPLWFQTPLVIVVAIAFSLLCAYGLYLLIWKIFPVSDDEYAVLHGQKKEDPQ